MALWFRLHLNDEQIGVAEVQRRDVLDLADPATADAVSTYVVRLDGRTVGTLTHRYGNGAWSLVAKAADLIAGVEQ